MGNRNLIDAKRNKNDEFYTQSDDISQELRYYRGHFSNKIVYLNCDNPEASEFWKFFERNFDAWNIKKVISTYYDNKKPTFKLEINRDNYEEIDEIVSNQIREGKTKLELPNKFKTRLGQNGDFRGQESTELLKESDIVVTNPPFSLFREYISQLMEYEKKFLVIGSMNAITYKEVFPFIKENELWLGYNAVKRFMQPDGTEKVFGNILWYTNLEHNKRNEEMFLYKRYTPELYPRYDNYDAIEVSKVKNIPKDYCGLMGVPITFLRHYNPSQFEIIDRCNSPILNGKGIYKRLIIKRKED